VYEVRSANGTNDLQSVHVSSFRENGAHSEVRSTNGSALSDGELFSDVHTEAHSLNDCEQKASAHSALSALHPEPSEDKEVARDEDMRQRIAAQRQKFDNPNITPPGRSSPF
jgi:hypothetical protein